MLLPLVLATLTLRPQAADLIITNARIWSDGRVIQGDSIAIVGGKFLYIGKSSPDFVGPKTEILNARQHLVIPGLIDSYAHLAESSSGQASLQLASANNKDDFLKRIKDYAATVKPGQWIRAQGWSSQIVPSKESIDPVTGDRPTFILSIDGHSALVNTAALVLAHISKDGPPDPPNGSIQRDPATHEPTGVLTGSALNLIPAPPTTPDEDYKALLEAIKAANPRGITAISEVCDFSKFDLWRRYMSTPKPTLRAALYANEGPNWQELVNEVKTWPGVPGWLDARGIACSIDGTIAAGAAYMHSPYVKPMPGQQYPRGLESKSMLDGTYTKGFPLAAAAGLQILAHASGDEANHDLLNLISAIPNVPSSRFRTEGAAYILPADLPRFNQLGLTVTLDPGIQAGAAAATVASTERPAADTPLFALARSGVKVAFSSPEAGPFTGLEALTAVKPTALTFDQALTNWTANGAYAMEREKDLGRIAKGYRADFVILNDWPYQKGFAYSTLAPEEVFVDGRVVYRRP